MAPSAGAAQARVGDGSSEERVATLIRQCSRFLYDEPICVGFGPDPRRRLPGVYRAIRVCPEQEPAVLAVFRRPGGLLVIAGPKDEVARFGRTKPTERYVPAQPIAEGERRPPSIARDTASAMRAMDVILAGEGIREHLLDLELGELVCSHNAVVGFDAKALAHELPALSLADALALVLLMADRHHPAFRLAAARWSARLVLEHRLDLEQTRFAIDAPTALPHQPPEAKRRLADICALHQVRNVIGLPEA